MISDFLIINFIGKKNSIGLRIDNNFFVKKFQINIKNNDTLVGSLIDFTKEKKLLLIISFRF